MIYYFLFMNMLSFLLFGIDKKKSIEKEYRIPEKVLLFISSLGGAFGSLFAIFYFHHKNRKLKFLLWIPIDCILWTFLFVILTSNSL